MARNKGTFQFAANFEIKAAVALDPRMVVNTFSDLTNKETWPYDGDTLYVYNGMVVSVIDEGALYMLINQDNVLDESSWIRVDGSASMYKGVPVVSQTTDATKVTIAPNVMNVWEEEVTNLTITKDTTAEVEGIVNNYMIRFTAGVGTVLIFDGEDVKWYGGTAPEWVSGNTYEISIVDNIALWAEFEA